MRTSTDRPQHSKSHTVIIKGFDNGELGYCNDTDLSALVVQEILPGAS